MCVRWGWIQSATSSTQTGCYLLSDRRRSEANCHSHSRGEMQRCDKSLKNDYHSQHHLSQVLLFWTWVEMNSFKCIIIQFTCLKKASGWFQALITLLCDLMVCVCVCATDRDRWKIHSLMSAEVTTSTAQAGLLSRCQYLPRVLKDSHHTSATMSLHPRLSIGRVCPAWKKQKKQKTTIRQLVSPALACNLVFNYLWQICFDDALESIWVL